jgi:hypothetical protein
MTSARGRRELRSELEFSCVSGFHGIAISGSNDRTMGRRLEILAKRTVGWGNIVVGCTGIRDKSWWWVDSIFCSDKGVTSFN